jgi:hypothetical protein
MMSGFYEGTDLAEKTFYGFRLNHADGGLVVEVINDGSPVVLPQQDVVDPNDYKQWVWSQDTLRFVWDRGHLQVKII